MKALFFALFSLSISVAFATPGDQACKGTTEDGKSVELLLGYDNFQQYTPSLVQITVDGEVVYVAAEINDGMQNMNTEAEPFYNRVLTTNDEESTATIQYPEQDTTNEDTYSVYLTVITDSGIFSTEGLELTCEY